MDLSFRINCAILNIFLNCLIFSIVIGKDTFSENQVLNEEFNKHDYYATVNESGHKILRSEENKNLPWFLNIPLLPAIVATSNSIPEGSCKRQLQLYLTHLKNGTLWATEMFDSSAKYPYGLFNGFTRHLGSFDQCERIQTTLINHDGEIEEIRSRYCLVDVKFKENNEPKNFSGEHNIFFDPQSSAWEAIREKGDFRRYQRYSLQMALCFPAKCQTEEIVTALKQPLDEFGEKYDIQIEASISPLYCSSATKDAPEFSNYDKIFCFTFLLMLSAVIISTIIDRETDQKEELSLLLCFSARKNLKKIFRINYAHRGFDSIHFIRVLLAVMTIFGHRLFENMYTANINGTYLEWVASNHIFGLLHNIPIGVDGFFGVGGVLLSYFYLEHLNEFESEKIGITIFFFIKRLVRLLPLYMFVTFAYATLFHRLGSGPFWESTMGFIRDSCTSHWWTNLFFINNYFGGNNKCVIQSWYMSVEFHCFIIGLLIIYAFNEMSRKIGYLFLSCMLILSAGIPFYFTYKNDLDPIFTTLVNPRRIEDSEYFLNYYVRTHLRLAAYVTGLIVGVFLYDHKNASWRLSKTWSKILFNIAIATSLITMWIGTFFMNPNLKTSAFQKALYASLHRPIFAFGICSIPLLLTIGDGLDFYYNLLTAKWLQPISRISYGIFLVHFVIHHFEFGTTRTAVTFSFYNLAKHFVGDVVYSICLALLLVLVIEYPFRNIFNVILQRKMVVKEKIS